jgi:hypothetical protein
MDEPKRQLLRGLTATDTPNAVWVRREVSLLGQTIDWQFGPRQLVAVGAILFLSVLNCFAVAFGGKVPLFFWFRSTGQSRQD